jgi:acetyl-CoA carboxylase biotin carboxyl carrier protein
MTAVDGTVLRAGATGLGEVLAVLREHAMALGTATAQPPTRVRVEAAGVVLELDWARPGAGPAPAATAAEVAARNGAPGLPAVPQPNGAAQPNSAAQPNGAARADAADGAGAPPGHRVTAPTVGVFYRAPEPGAQPFVAVGDAVAPGQQLAIVEAMKLMIPVEADRAGRVAEVLCADGEAVEFGQPLFAIGDGGSPR